MSLFPHLIRSYLAREARLQPQGAPQQTRPPPPSASTSSGRDPEGWLLGAPSGVPSTCCRRCLISFSQKSGSLLLLLWPCPSSHPSGLLPPTPALPPARAESEKPTPPPSLQLRPTARLGPTQHTERLVSGGASPPPHTICPKLDLPGPRSHLWWRSLCGALMAEFPQLWPRMGSGTPYLLSFVTIHHSRGAMA